MKRMMAVRSWVLVSGLVLGCGGGSGTPTEPPVQVAAPSGTPEATTTAAGPRERTVGGVRVTIPEGWEDVPLKSDMLLAEFKLQGDAGPGRLTLSSAGGGVEANIARWRGQFVPGADDPAAVENEITVDGKPAVVVELYGTFQDGFGGGGPKPASAMLGAVLPTKASNFFIKLTGPRETINTHKEAFLNFVQSVKFTN